MSTLDAFVQIDEPLGGARNMAIDEWLLEQATSDSPLNLRVYRWSEPTLSLGHFQHQEDIPTEASWAGLPRVQRKTGGGAIVHDQELTYSIVIPQRPEVGLKGHCEPIYRAVHEQFVEALKNLGWDARLAEECNCKVAAFGTDTHGEKAQVIKERKENPGTNGAPFLCFDRRSPVDVVVGGAKLIGSAQRRTNRGLLQHGSILLRASHAAPGLLGLLDLVRTRGSQTSAGPSPKPAPEGHAANHIDSLDWRFWTGWLVDNLTIGLNKILQCYWRLRPADYNSMGVSPAQKLTET
jgi:lipoate-protein ligase A